MKELEYICDYCAVEATYELQRDHRGRQRTEWVCDEHWFEYGDQYDDEGWTVLPLEVPA